MKCEYGCNQEAQFQLKNNKWCCSIHVAGCSEHKRRVSNSIKKAHVAGKYLQAYVMGKCAWNTGLTKKTDERVRKSAETCRSSHKVGNWKPWNKGKTKYTDNILKRVSLSMSNIQKNIHHIPEWHTLETCMKISASLKGRQHSTEHSAKIRLSGINWVEKNKLNGNQLIPRWNPVACQKIDEYGKQYGYNFKHAMNGGEYFISQLGYWVDGYDKEKNTVIEYYEKKHNLKVQKDFERETEICNHLRCDFIILWEK